MTLSTKNLFLKLIFDVQRVPIKCTFHLYLMFADIYYLHIHREMFQLQILFKEAFEPPQLHNNGVTVSRLIESDVI